MRFQLRSFLPTVILILALSIGASAQWLTSVASGTPTANSTTITWTSCTPATTTVNYGLAASYGLVSSNSTLATAHSAALSGLTAATTYHFQVVSTDSTGVAVVGKDQTFTTTAITPPPSSITFWPTTQLPVEIDSNDAQSVELGMKFNSDVAGSVTAIRFYKSAKNTGTHTGTLWTTGGTKLATGTFTGETSSGWQELKLPSPIAITAGATYIVSYHTTVGHYSDDVNYFAKTFNVTPLHAPIAAGVYVYGSSAFPKLLFQNTNYWVDIRFAPGSVIPPPPPPQLKPNLSWDPSVIVPAGNPITGYRVYRGTITGGPYTLLTSPFIVGTSYIDTTATTGSYFYVATAVDSAGQESIHSNEIKMVVP